MTSTPSAVWPQYYQATAGRAPRPLLIQALAAYENEPEAARERLAVDIGCGDGTETLELLARGWNVLALDSTPEGIARLRSRVPADQADRVQTRIASFAGMALPPADLIFAGLSLPFCHPSDFEPVWAKIRGALKPGARFAGHLFGERDLWASSADMTFHTRAQAEARFASLTVESFREVEEDGKAVSGPKHWHFFEIIARREEEA